MDSVHSKTTFTTITYTTVYYHADTSKAIACGHAHAKRMYDVLLARGRAHNSQLIASSSDSRDSPAPKLQRHKHVHMRIGTGCVAPRKEMGLPRQKDSDEVT